MKISPLPFRSLPILPAALTLLPFTLPPASATELADIIVTATRTAQTTDETLSSVTVVTREDMELRQVQSVQDALRGIPGLSIASNGGAGHVTSFFLRGAASDQVLVLIDGIKVGSATLGTTSLQHIPIEQIDRIEVVRGPRSSLYGSEAIGGVIQIFTRSGKGKGEIKPHFYAGYGKNQTRRVSTGISGDIGKGWVNLSVDSQDTEGFNVQDGNEPDSDGYRSLSGALRVGYLLQDDLKVDLHLLQADNAVEFDGSFQDETESIQQTIGGTLTYDPTKNWRIILAAGRSRDETESFKDGVPGDRFETERDTFSVQNDFVIRDGHQLNLGIDYQDDEVGSTKDYTATSRDNTGLFAQYQGVLSAHDLQLSLRRDDNEQFGQYTTGSAAWGYAFRDGLRLTASYGTAFKAPTFNDIYYPGFGNDSLEPEKSKSFELGLIGEADWGDWSLNAYETHIDNMIAYDSVSWIAYNQDARIRGLETVLATDIMDWDVNANLTLLDPKDRSSGNNRGNVLARRARQSLRVDADRQLGPYTVGATLLAAGRRYNDTNNSVSLGGYATLDLRAEYEFANDWRLQARVENLLDKDYETAAGYNQPGRSAFIGVRYSSR